MAHASQAIHTPDENLVEIWLRRDPLRWMAGILASAVAVALSLGVAMFLCQSAGMDLWFPVKLMATPILGAAATETGFHTGHIATGTVFYSLIAVFWGVIYAHFTATNRMLSLLAMGLAWGAFSWIFTWNLFLQSFQPIFAAQISAGPAFAVSMAYGIGLASVGIFDRMMGGSRGAAAMAKAARGKH